MMTSFPELKKFYSGKKVLITGSSGFKGAWLSLWLSEYGAEVTGFSMNPPSKPNLFTILNLRKTITEIKGDIRKYSEINNTIKKSKPDIIFHLAAQPILLKSYDLPVDTFATNVMGTVNLLDSAYRQGTASSILNVTTDKCYQNVGRRVAYNEEDKLGGSDPYSASKAASELATVAYSRSFFLKKGIGVSTARAGNIIGGGDWGEYRLVPSMATSFSKGKAVMIRNPNAIRPWQYVLDALNGYLILAMKNYREPEKYSGAWNFGPEQDSIRTVTDFAEQFSNAWGNGKIKIQKSNKNHEDQILLLNSTKARSRLNWKSMLEFEDMVSITAKWYKQYYKNEDMCEATKKLIKEYVSRT